MSDALARRGVHVPGRDGINVWVPVAEQGAALLHLASSGVRAASGDPFWISTPQKAHIRLTTASIREGYDDLADVVAEAARASTWAGHR
jgi:DNA-binding transcriptional MocR family regulator